MIAFHGEYLLAPLSNLQAVGPPLSAVRCCLLNVFSAAPRILHKRKLCLCEMLNYQVAPDFNNFMQNP
jgi:hypothetical protein